METFFKVLRYPERDEPLLPKAFVRKNRNRLSLRDQYILKYDGLRSWALTYKEVNEGITITDGWKKVVDDLGLKRSSLLGFTPFEPYVYFMLTVFNVDFIVLCKSQKKLSNFCLVDKVGDKQSSFSYIILEPSCTHVVLPSTIIILVRCYNGVYNVMVDEGYTRRIKIGRSRDQFFFCRPVGDRMFKLTMFSPDGTQLFLANPQPIPLAQHDVEISSVVVCILIDCVIVKLCLIGSSSLLCSIVGWKKKNGIEDGAKCSMSYNHVEGTLYLIRVSR
ncbi:putative transcription factor B3-Domain family [Helianthus anomalus]